MRTILKSDHSVYFLAVFLTGLVFALGIKFMPKTFAEDEDSEAPDYSLVSSEHYVTVFDNGTKKTVLTNAETVSEVLSRLNISLAESDGISPSLDSLIDADHFFINIYRSRPIMILDGTIKKVANVSSFDPKTAVRSAGFTIYDGDEIELVSTSDFLATGISSAYKIIRGEGSTLTLESDLDFSTETIKDYTIPSGTEEVRVLGEVGKIRRVYKIQTVNGEEISRELVEETVLREPVNRVVAVGTSIVNATPLTASMGRNRYTATNLSGEYVERQETYYDLPMSGVMAFCGKSGYTVREDGAKVDDEGYVLVAANLTRYPRCSVVETSLGLGKVYDTGTFALTNPEQFDLATDWTNRDGR